MRDWSTLLHAVGYLSTVGWLVSALLWAWKKPHLRAAPTWWWLLACVAFSLLGGAQAHAWRLGAYLLAAASFGGLVWFKAVPARQARWRARHVDQAARSRVAKQTDVNVTVDNRKLLISLSRGQAAVNEHCKVVVTTPFDVECRGICKGGQVVFPDEFVTADAAEAPAPSARQGLYRIRVYSDKFTMWQDPQGYVMTESVREPPLAYSDFMVTEEELLRSSDEWHSLVRFVVPSPELPMPHKIILELTQREGRRAKGPVRCEVRFGGQTFEAPEDRVIFTERNLEPDELPHYYVFFPDGFESAPGILSDGRYEVRWLERHAMGYRLRHDPHAFEIRNGEVVMDGD